MVEVNGIDTKKLNETCGLIEKNPSLAKSQFRAHNTWIKGGNNKVGVKSYYVAGEEQETRSKPFEFEADEPPALLGEDRGANPVEYLLVALSSCMTSSIAFHAAANGIEIRSMESHFEGDLDLRGFLGLSEDVPKGYQKIRVKFVVDTDAPVEEIAKFYHFSPVYSIVSKSVPVEVEVVKP